MSVHLTAKWKAFLKALHDLWALWGWLSQSLLARYLRQFCVKTSWRTMVGSLLQQGDIMTLQYGPSGWLTREEESTRKENWVTAVDAIVNKEMTRESRQRACFIRSFKGVMCLELTFIKWAYEGDRKRDTTKAVSLSEFHHSLYTCRHIFVIYMQL